MDDETRDAINGLRTLLCEAIRSNESHEVVAARLTAALEANTAAKERNTAAQEANTAMLRVNTDRAERAMLERAAQSVKAAEDD